MIFVFPILDNTFPSKRQNPGNRVTQSCLSVTNADRGADEMAVLSGCDSAYRLFAHGRNREAIAGNS